MNREQSYERSEIAGRMEVVMYIVTGVSVLAGVFAFLYYGWLLALGFLILGALAFGLGRVFELLGELFASSGVTERKATVLAAEGAKTNA